MCANRCARHGRKFFSIAAACTLGFGATSGYCESSPSQQPSGASGFVRAAADLRHVAELERAFWICDYTATMRGVQATPIDLCTAVWNELKNDKFGGDFVELLKWWRQNKLTEHGKLENDGW